MIQFLPLLAAAVQGAMNGGGLTGAAKGAAGSVATQGLEGLMDKVPQGTVNTNVLGQGGATQKPTIAPQGYQSALGGQGPVGVPPTSPSGLQSMGNRVSVGGMPQTQQLPFSMPGQMGAQNFMNQSNSILSSFPGMPTTQWDPRMMGMRRGY